MGSPPPADSATVISVQPFCLHDGPGIRSVVFFKGCPLSCAWCQNPESWHQEPELAFKARLCIACGRCVDACPNRALSAPGQWVGDRCPSCFECTRSCPSGALVRIGSSRDVPSLVDELVREQPFFSSSGGGVTLSGGEPTLAATFAARLAGALQTEGIHVAMETCGLFALDKEVESLLQALDLVLFDLKVFDDVRHRQHCGAGNRRITTNLRAIADRARSGVGPALWPRLPVVPGITDEASDLRAWARLLLELDLSRLTLVPYHRLGESKRAWLGLPAGPVPTGDVDEAVETTRRRFEADGLMCYAPGEEDW